ncbi:hypothetical protein BKA93DRAFT_752363 [Sparassis latifolia]
MYLLFKDHELEVRHELLVTPNGMNPNWTFDPVVWTILHELQTLQVYFFGSNKMVALNARKQVRQSAEQDGTTSIYTAPDTNSPPRYEDQWMTDCKETEHRVAIMLDSGPLSRDEWKKQQEICTKDIEHLLSRARVLPVMLPDCMLHKECPDIKEEPISSDNEILDLLRCTCIPARNMPDRN